MSYYFTAATIFFVCQKISSVFSVLGIYNIDIRLDQETSDLNSRCKIFSLFMNQTQNENQALKEKLSEEEVARQHKQREISEMLKLQQAKSLCKSLALSNFYETEIEIWAGFGLFGNIEKKIGP